MRVHVLHLFCNGVLAETRVFENRQAARQAEWQALVQLADAMFVEGEVIDANGSTWTGAIESVELERGREWPSS